MSGRLISSAHPQQNNITYTQRVPFNNAENILTDNSKYNERQRSRRRSRREGWQWVENREKVAGAPGVREKACWLIEKIHFNSIIFRRLRLRDISTLPAYLSACLAAPLWLVLDVVRLRMPRPHYLPGAIIWRQSGLRCHVPGCALAQRRSQDQTLFK